jgi:hypothetical protein
MRVIFLLALSLSALSNAQAASNPFTITNAQGGKVECWLESSLKRVFPLSTSGSTNLDMLTARNATVSFQVCVRNTQEHWIDVNCAISNLAGVNSRVRVVGLVPLPHLTPNTAASELDGASMLPGLVPDPLYPEDKLTIGSFETRSFWITLLIAEDATPGLRDLAVQLTWDNPQKKVTLHVPLTISSFVVQPRHDFHVIHWWRGEATWDYYKTGMFDDRWYSHTRNQLTDMLQHGSDVVYVPVFFDRREIFKHPCQLLKVQEPSPGKYVFDWSEVKKFTDMCKSVGFKQFEWSHIWIYWGVRNPVRVYKQEGTNFVTLWPPDISGFSDTYVNFLKQFLPEFHDFLAKENLLDCSYFHLSDEPGGEAVDRYRKARQILRDIAPWMKVMDALSDIRYGREGLTDMPIPMVDAAQNYIKEGIPHWVYYCCLPEGPWVNRFMDTPLSKVRMAGWLFYKLQAKGFLHWGYNYWDKMESEQAGDPFHDGSSGGWPYIPYGDPFVVYPGPDGPLDSIRWEVFAESLQDYAILQTAHIDPKDDMLAELKTYADFPKSDKWIEAQLRKILVDKKQTSEGK